MATNFPTKRRSMLGRRHLRTALLTNSEEKKPPVPRPTLVLPTPGRGLNGHRKGLNKSCKKTQKNLFVDYSSAKKPQATMFTINRANFNFVSPNISTGSYSSLSDSSLNLTGVQPIPSPETSSNKLATKSWLSVKLEPPKSPGVSLFDKMMKKRLNNIKPPIDPDDVTNNIKNLNINTEREARQDLDVKSVAEEKDVRSYHTKIKVSPLFPSKVSKTSPYLSKHNYNSFESKFSPHLFSTCVDRLVDNIEENLLETKPKTKCPSVSSSAKKLSIINENKESFDEEQEVNETLKDDDLNSTDSFLCAEQTIVDHDVVFKVPTATKAPKTSATTGNTDVLETPEEEDLILKLLSKVNHIETEVNNAMITINRAMGEMSQIKPILQQLLEKQRQDKDSDKENCPVTTSKKEKKWISDLKNENPNLLKTPKTNRESIINRPTWTPHSLSVVLQGQVNDLFDD